MRIEQGNPSDLAEYESVSIGFWVEERFDPNTGQLVPSERFWKDYDETPNERPTSLAERYDLMNSLILLAYDEDELVGGALLVHRSDYEMLDGRQDRAVLVDIRVSENLRRSGIGSSLFDLSIEWAWEQGCDEVLIETQDVNATACRFYLAKGCEIIDVQSDAYPGLNETMIVWRIAKQRG